jgi:two-component system response regulator AlgR
MTGSSALRVLVVDDEALARLRLKTLLADCREPTAVAVAEAGGAVAAMHLLQHEAFDVVLLDIHMPGTDGLALANAVRQLADPPAVVFVTAHAEHAVQAFELEAADYLTKPVRLERLQAALQKVKRLRAAAPGLAAVLPEEVLIIQDRGKTLRVPLAEVLYLKAELKYVTVRTAGRSHILDGALSELEERYATRFLRVHRNALVARSAIRALERHVDPEEGEGWAVRLAGVEELLAVSRRQLSAVRQVISAA